jgi:Neuraminidase (sialidase)
LVSDWSERLADEDDPAALRAIRSSTGAGRRLGGKGLLERLEVQLGRRVMPRKRVWAASEDGGRNWSEPQPVPMPIPGSAEQTSPLCVARSGAWHACYSPYNTFDPQVKPERNQVVLLTSRDRGRTWRHTAMLRWPDPLSTAAEAWVVELADGRLLGGKEWTVPELKGHSALRRETSYDLMLAEGLR